jgi:hypothetical protein
MISLVLFLIRLCYKSPGASHIFGHSYFFYDLTLNYYLDQTYSPFLITQSFYSLILLILVHMFKVTPFIHSFTHLFHGLYVCV